MLHPLQLFCLEVEVRLRYSRGKQTNREASGNPRLRQLAALHGARALQMYWSPVRGNRRKVTVELPFPHFHCFSHRPFRKVTSCQNVNNHMLAAPSHSMRTVTVSGQRMANSAERLSVGGTSPSGCKKRAGKVLSLCSTSVRNSSSTQFPHRRTFSHCTVGCAMHHAVQRIRLRE